MKARAGRVIRDAWRHTAGRGYSPADVVRRCVKYANNFTVCSCAMCGNPRRWSGDVTLAELRADDTATAEQVGLSRADAAAWAHP